eukprot:364282-Chlamydomonas_euryale.AAC.24
MRARLGESAPGRPHGLSEARGLRLPELPPRLGTAATRCLKRLAVDRVRRRSCCSRSVWKCSRCTSCAPQLRDLHAVANVAK